MSADKKSSPSFLAPKHDVKKANKKILMSIVLIVVGLLIVLFLSMTSPSTIKTDTGLSATSVDTEDKPLSSAVEGFDLAIPDVPDIKGKKEESKEPQIKVDPEEEARRREADEILRRKFERDQQAYSSNILVKRENSTAAGNGVGSVDKDGDGYIDEPPNVSIQANMTQLPIKIRKAFLLGLIKAIGCRLMAEKPGVNMKLKQVLLFRDYDFRCEFRFTGSFNSSNFSKCF